MSVEHLPSKLCFHLLSVYAPADCDTARAEFFASLPITSSTILLGDFNVVTSPLDRTSTTTSPFSSSVSARSLTTLCSKFDLHDIWRTLHPSDILHSFRRGNFSARLDRILIPAALLPLAKSCTILINPQDHAPVTLSLNTNTVQMGKDRFFCNTSLFTHAYFRPQLLSHLSNLANIATSRNVSPSDRWEWFKTHTLSYLLIQSPIFANKREKEIAALNAAIATLDARVHADPCNLELHSDRTQTLEALAAHDAYILKGKALRSQHFRNFVKERVPKHIAKLETQAATNKVIHSIRTSPLSSTSNPAVMLEHARSYWGKVFHAPEYGPYTATSPAAQSRFLTRYANNPLPSHLDELLSKTITLQEFHDIAPSLPKHRSNGPDGIPYEFYSDPDIWNIIAPLFFSSITHSIQIGLLPESMRECDIVLLFKKDERDIISNYRPISVLNCDYRFLARVLVRRLNPVAQHLVHPDQTGFIKNRLISDNGILLNSLLEYAEYDPSSISGAMVFLDYEKAFDSIEWEWMFKVLTARGIPAYFVNLIKMLYNIPTASIIINGYRSRSFLTGRGVRQGCPLSPLLFALCIEPLADTIRCNLFIRGVRIPKCSRSAKISLFADDTTTFIADLHDWNIIKEILCAFSRASGLRLNYNKLLGVWLSPSGIPPPELKNEFPWLAKGQKERILGYRLGIGLDPNDQLQHAVDRIRERLLSYCPHIYSPSGRVLLLKMCIHSLLWYFAYVTPPSKSLLATLNRWCYNFIWRKFKQPLTFDRALSGKVSRAVLALPRALGGLNYQKLEIQLSSLRMKWIRHLLDTNNDALETSSSLQSPLARIPLAPPLTSHFFVLL